MSPLRVQGLGPIGFPLKSPVRGSGFTIEGSGVRGFGVPGLGFRDQGVWGLGIRVWGSGFRDQGLGFGV